MILFGTLKSSLYICNIIKTYNKMTIEEIGFKKVELNLKVNSLIKIKKEKFPNIDISMPMCNEEKQLTKDIANLYSEINNLVKLKNKLRKELAL